MSFKPIDAKRDEFRKYLERTGVLEAISKVFIKLIHCPERPENAIDYICANLGSTLHQNDQIENLQKDLEESKDEIAQLKQIIENLKTEKKVTAVNEESIQLQQQGTVEEFNNQNSLSDDGINVEKQMENISLAVDATGTVNQKELSLTKSTSSDCTPEDISPAVHEKNTETKNNTKSDAVSDDLVTDTELTQKIEASVE